MSEEEINKKIDYFNQFIIEVNNEQSEKILRELMKFINEIIDLYNKEKEKNASLQKEIEELKEKDNSKYYHTINAKELENEINNAWKNKIRELKQKVEEEMISNPYDFSYMIQELLEE